MPAPAVVPMLFDEAAIAYGLRRRPRPRPSSGASWAPHGLKTFVPWEQNKWGWCYSSSRTRSVRSRFAFAYGTRHPTGVTASVYHIAHKRLNHPA